MSTSILPRRWSGVSILYLNENGKVHSGGGPAFGERLVSLHLDGTKSPQIYFTAGISRGWIDWWVAMASSLARRSKYKVSSASLASGSLAIESTSLSQVAGW